MVGATGEGELLSVTVGVAVGVDEPGDEPGDGPPVDVVLGPAPTVRGLLATSG
jgi:hypothetical protein